MADWPHGDGEMARRMRALDWAATPLGPCAQWPQSLRTAVELILASGHAMQLAWGPARIMIYNDGYAPMLGQRHPQALGIPFREAWPDIWTEIEPLVDSTFAGETVRFDGMPLLMTRRGYPEETWWDFSYSPVRDESGAVAGLLNVTLDATPRHLAQRAERASEEKYRRLFDAMDEGVCTIRLLRDEHTGAVCDFIMLEVNPAYERHTGLSDTVGRRGSEIVPGLGSWMTTLARVAATGESTRWEYEVAQIGRWFNTFVSPIGPKEDLLLSLVFNDITERKRAEALLQERDERQTFLLKLSDALRAAGSEREIVVMATRMVAEELGLDRCYIATMDVAEDRSDMIHEQRRDGLVPVPQTLRLSDFPDAVGRTLTETLVLGDVLHDARLSALDRQSLSAMSYGALLAAPVRRGAGNPIWCFAAVSAAPRAWSAGEIALVETVAERTWAAAERAHAEAALRESDRRKDQFLAVLGHELRNGLAPLVYNVQIGNRRGGDAALTTQLFARSDRQLRHLVHLVDDLLDVARISNGKIELKLETVPVREVVDLALETARPEAERKQQRLDVVDEAGPGLVVRGDRVRLTQVVSNLLSNASKYTHERGSIIVRIAREDDQARIEVSDTGIGIAAAALPAVFELFSQVHDQRQHAAGGLGIGLSLVKQLAELHGGSVGAASEGPGRGSRFAVRLPALLAPAALRPPPNAANAADEGREAPRALRVLVVDDRRDAADTLVELLTLQGHEADAAYSGPQALAAADRRRPDLVLLDLGMPGMDGLEVARHLRAQLPAMPPLQIVALTGRGQDADRHQTRAAGFDGHLTKPPQAQELESVLHAARRQMRA